MLSLDAEHKGEPDGCQLLCLHVECGKELTLVDRFYNGRERVTNLEAGSSEKRVADYLVGESVAVATDPFCPCPLVCERVTLAPRRRSLTYRASPSLDAHGIRNRF